MGFRVLLISIRGKDHATIHSECGVVPTQEYEEVPESQVTARGFSDGQYLLYVSEAILPDDGMLSTLSRDAEVLYCYVNETVMDSLTSSWVNGTEKWRVYHSANQRVTHLEAGGMLPEEFADIKKRLFEAQNRDDEADYIFDIPIDLFVALGGMRYNQYVEGTSPKPWQVLRRTQMREDQGFSIEAFAESLRRLTERNKEDAFVILEDRVSGKFVQFGRGTTIKIDLPLASLDEVETDRAADWFRNLGVESPGSFDAPDPRESGRLRSQASFEFDFGTDARRAAYSALDLFAAVYQLSNGVVWNVIEN
jgi:hypothetical protein